MTDDELIAAALGVLQRRAAGAASGLTVAQLFDRYEAAKKRTRGWRTTGSALRAIRDYAYAPDAAPLGQRDVMGLRVLDWTDYRSAKLEEEWADGRKRTPWTVDLHLAALKAMLNWAVEEGRIPHNPLERAKRRSKSRREIAPDEGEIGAQLAEADVQRRFIVLASGDAGMRRNEIRLCEHGWVDARAKRIHLGAEACKGQRARTIPVTTRLLDAIEAIPRHVRAPWILTNPATEQPYSYTSFWRWFRGVADAAGQPGVRLHDNRHGAATNAVDRGVKLTAVQKMLGHADLATTLIYVNARAKYAEADLSAALEAIERGIASDRAK